MKNKHRLLRKNPIFYSRNFYLNYLENSCKGNELTFFENMLRMGDLLHYLHGFIRREKRIKTKDEVFNYYMKVFNSEYRGDRIMHKHIDDLRLIMSYYD